MSSPHKICRSDPNQNPPAWLVYLVLGVVAAGLYFLLSGGVEDTLYNLVGASAAIAILIGVYWSRSRPTLACYVVAGAFHERGTQDGR